MKKFLTLLLALTVMFSLISCQGDSLNESSLNESEHESAESNTSSEQSQEGIESGTQDDDTADIDVLKINRNVTIEETVLYDSNNVKISAVGISEGILGTEIDLKIENSGNIDIIVSNGSAVSVNGYTLNNASVRAEVPAGKTAYPDLTLFDEVLLLSGITDIAEISFSLEICDDEYNSIFNTGYLTIETSAKDGYEKKNGYKTVLNDPDLLSQIDSELIFYTERDLLSNEYVDLVSQAMINDSYGNDVFILEFENKYHEDLLVNISALAINGLVFPEAINYSWIAKGTKTLISFEVGNILSENFPEHLGLTAISDFTFAVNVADSNGSNLIFDQRVEYTVESERVPLNMSGKVVYDTDDFRVISKGWFNKNNGSENEYCLVFIIENNWNKTIKYGRIGGDYLAINKGSIKYDVQGVEILPGTSGLVTVTVKSKHAEEHGIYSINDIDNFTFTVATYLDSPEAYKLLFTCTVSK